MTPTIIAPNSLGDRLRKLRKEKKFNQTYISKQLGVSRSTLGKYETNDRSPNPACLQKLAKLYDVSTDYLLNGDASIDVSVLLNPKLDITYNGMPLDDRKRVQIRQIIQQEYEVNTQNMQDMQKSQDKKDGPLDH